MMIRAIVLAVLMAVPAAAAEVPARTVVPWGERPGTLRLLNAEAGSRSPYTGPSSMRVGPDGDLYVLNTCGHTVERFSVDGIHRKSYAYPANDAHDAARCCTDLAIAPDGGLLLLDPQSRTVLVLNRDGSSAGEVAVPVTGKTGPLLTGLEVSSDGSIVVLDGYDNRLLHFDRKGAPIASATCDLASNLVRDGDGWWYGVGVPSQATFKAFDAWREEPFTRKREKLARVEARREVGTSRLLGRDSKGRLFVDVGFGGGDQPDKPAVYVVDGGKCVARIEASLTQLPFPMVRPAAVTAEGALIVPRFDGRGLILERYPAPKPRSAGDAPPAASR